MSPERIAALLAPFLGAATLTATQLSQLAAYLDLLLRWNARMNLTAVRDPEPIVTRHFGESLFAARHLYPSTPQLATGNWQLLDLGSGAGFPGLPIKLWAPPLRVVLLEAKYRKAIFLREVVRSLELPQVEVVAARAEAYAASPAPPAAGFTVTLRAVERFLHILPAALRILENFPAARRRLALLIGGSQLPAVRRLAPALAWSGPFPIPHSARRVLLIGNA